MLEVGGLDFSHVTPLFRMRFDLWLVRWRWHNMSPCWWKLHWALFDTVRWIFVEILLSGHMVALCDCCSSHPCWGVAGFRFASRVCTFCVLPGAFFMFGICICPFGSHFKIVSGQLLGHSRQLAHARKPASSLSQLANDHCYVSDHPLFFLYLT